MLLLSAAMVQAETPVYGPEPAAEDYRHGRPPRERYRREHRRAEGPPPRPGHDVTITLSADLANPHVTGGAELALGRHASVGFDAGLGAYANGLLYDVQAEARAYPFGDFDRGLFVGAGGGMTNLTPLTLGETASTAQANIGGKLTLPFGLSAEGSLGVAWYGMPELGFVAPTARVGVGWSF